MSKSYNMPGWRVGFMCGNKELVGALARIKSYLDYGTFTPIQIAAIAALLTAGGRNAILLGRRALREPALMAAARPGTLFIDSSTIDVATAREVQAFLDALASGKGRAALERAGFRPA